MCVFFFVVGFGCGLSWFQQGFVVILLYRVSRHVLRMGLYNRFDSRVVVIGCITCIFCFYWES